MITKPKARKFRIRRTSPLTEDTVQSAAPSPAPAPQRPTAGATTPRPVSATPRPAAPTGAPSRPSAAPVQPPVQPPVQARPAAQTEAVARRLETPIPQPEEDAFSMSYAVSGSVDSADQVTGDQDIDAIRREGLTGRQLRMARRVAQKHGMAPTSDFDAVRLLRAAGIDPFQRSTILEMVVPQSGDGGSVPPPPTGAPQLPATTGKPQLRQTVPLGQVPVTQIAQEKSPADRRAVEIMAIQRDIARRRRRRMFMLFSRLSFFVFLPTLITAYYFFVIATPMYATKSEFLILQADSTGGGGALGGLLTGTQFATNQDSIAVQSFLASRDAMLRLDKDIGFKDHFSQDHIDPIQALPDNPSDEKAYKLYRKYVKIGYDPTEGVIKMEVSAADPATSAAYSEHLIKYAEERVDDLSKRKREDQMRDASGSLAKAKEERRQAQAVLVKLQEDSLLDPEGEVASIRGLMNSVEMQLQEKEFALNTQLNNSRPNQAKVTSLQTEVRLLREELDRQNARLNEATNGTESLAFRTAQIQMAQADLATADLFLQSALQNEKQTELEANRQVRYLTTSVRPVAPDDPTYPRAFEDTILAFLIFSGIYLMLSITASILREQASS